VQKQYPDSSCDVAKFVKQEPAEPTTQVPDQDPQIQVAVMLTQCEALVKAGRAPEAMTLARKAYRLMPQEATFRNLAMVHAAEQRAAESAGKERPADECWFPCANVLGGMFDYLGCLLDGLFGNDVPVPVNAPLPVPPVPPPPPASFGMPQCPPS